MIKKKSFVSRIILILLLSSFFGLMAVPHNEYFNFDNESIPVAQVQDKAQLQSACEEHPASTTEASAHSHCLRHCHGHLSVLSNAKEFILFIPTIRYLSGEIFSLADPFLEIPIKPPINPI